MTRRYYSARTGKNPGAVHLDLPTVLRLFSDAFNAYSARGYFQQAFGYSCVDAGEVPGTLGLEVNAQMFRRIRKPDLWPITEKCLGYSGDDLFDVIEFLFDHVSKPVDGYYHEFGGCGWHYQTFNAEAGQQEYRAEMNDLLRDYREGYELSTIGEILALAEQGLETLLQADLPVFDPENVENRIRVATLKFRRYRSSPQDRRDAIRDLADVLEFLRPKMKLILTKSDEGELFNLANNFGIRHHNDVQKTDYDQSIWFSWMFYYYLATIHATLRLLVRQESGGSTTKGEAG